MQAAKNENRITLLSATDQPTSEKIHNNIRPPSGFLKESKLIAICGPTFATVDV